MARRQGTVSIKFDAENIQHKLEKRLKKRHADRVWKAMMKATQIAIDSTPTWTGDTIANYHWSIGKKQGSYTPHNQHYSWRAKIFPVKNPENAAMKSVARLLAIKKEVYDNPFQRFVFYNTVEYENGMNFLDLEYGQLTGKPYLIMAKVRQVLEAGV